ncbi:MAG: hypothetical protein ABIH82_05095 [Candidatus Woesearchaeota archaeon]
MSSLEWIVEKGIATGKVLLKTALPFLQEYDALSEADKLLKDKEIQRCSITREEIADYLTIAKEEYKVAMGLSKVADTSDRWISVAGAIMESAGMSAGIAPGFIMNLVEEAGELVFKLPILGYLAFNPEHRGRATGLVIREAATAGLPILGDIYDAGTNRYINTVKEIIRAEARSKILSANS